MNSFSLENTCIAPAKRQHRNEDIMSQKYDVYQVWASVVRDCPDADPHRPYTCKLVSLTVNINQSVVSQHLQVNV